MRKKDKDREVGQEKEHPTTTLKYLKTREACNQEVL